MDKCIGHWEPFRGIKGPHDSVAGLTYAVDIFEQFFDKDIVQKIVTKTKCYAEQFKNSRGNISSNL
jgi:hypothetical protein